MTLSDYHFQGHATLQATLGMCVDHHNGKRISIRWNSVRLRQPL